MTAIANPSSGFKWGQYYTTPKGDNGPYDTRQYAIGRQFDIASYFASFDTVGPQHTEWEVAAARGQKILLAWQPSRTVGLTFANILAGQFDTTIDAMINYLKTYPVEVVIRFGHEMNGNFMQWNPLYSGSSASSNCTSAAQFAQVWRYVVDRTRNVLGNPANIKWYFCANQNDTPGTGGVPLEDFYPGSTYVDYIGYDSYNGLNGLYMTPEQTFRGKTNNAQSDTYDRVCALHPTAPVWVGETGCVDLNDPKDTGNLAVGRDKAAWYTAAFALDQTTIPRLAAVNWFDSSGTRNWVHDTSTAAFSAFKTGLLVGAYTPAPAPVVNPNSAPAWVGETIGGGEVHDTPNTRDHKADHKGLWHAINQIITLVGGWTSLKGQSNGTAPAVTARAAQTGTVSEPILKIEPTSSADLKDALHIRATPDTSPTVCVQVGGKVKWGPGGTSATDTTLYRDGVGSLKTDGALAASSVSAATMTPVVSQITNSGSAPARPTSGQGVKVYAQADAPKVAQVGTAWTLQPQPSALHGRWLTEDPVWATTSFAPTAGTLYLRKVWVGDTRTLATIGAQVATAGAALTGVYLGVYTTGGTLLGSTADASTAYQSTGEKRTALVEASAGSLAVTPGYYYLAVLVVGGTTIPALVHTAGLATNWNLAASTARSATSGSGQTALPATVTMGSVGLQSKALFMDVG